MDTDWWNAGISLFNILQFYSCNIYTGLWEIDKHCSMALGRFHDQWGTGRKKKKKKDNLSHFYYEKIELLWIPTGKVFSSKTENLSSCSDCLNAPVN